MANTSCTVRLSQRAQGQAYNCSRSCFKAHGTHLYCKRCSAHMYSALLKRTAAVLIMMCCVTIVCASTSQHVCSSAQAAQALR
eukprot:17062-Heterococcus_DN1.PRE.1